MIVKHFCFLNLIKRDMNNNVELLKFELSEFE